jgi:hypothetical protein
MMLLFLVILIGGAFVIAVLASDRRFGPSDRWSDDKDKDKRPPPDSEQGG